MIICVSHVTSGRPCHMLPRGARVTCYPRARVSHVTPGRPCHMLPRGARVTCDSGAPVSHERGEEADRKEVYFSFFAGTFVLICFACFIFCLICLFCYYFFSPILPVLIFPFFLHLFCLFPEVPFRLSVGDIMLPRKGSSKDPSPPFQFLG